MALMLCRMQVKDGECDCCPVSASKRMRDLFVGFAHGRRSFQGCRGSIVSRSFMVSVHGASQTGDIKSRRLRCTMSRLEVVVWGNPKSGRQDFGAVFTFIRRRYGPILLVQWTPQPEGAALDSSTTGSIHFSSAWVDIRICVNFFRCSLGDSHRY